MKVFLILLVLFSVYCCFSPPVRWQGLRMNKWSEIFKGGLPRTPKQKRSFVKG